jgi:hypothetical protein
LGLAQACVLRELINFWPVMNKHGFQMSNTRQCNNHRRNKPLAFHSPQLEHEYPSNYSAVINTRIYQLSSMHAFRAEQWGTSCPAWLFLGEYFATMKQ